MTDDFYTVNYHPDSSSSNQSGSDTTDIALLCWITSNEVVTLSLLVVHVAVFDFSHLYFGWSACVVYVYFILFNSELWNGFIFYAEMWR